MRESLAGEMWQPINRVVVPIERVTVHGVLVEARRYHEHRISSSVWHAPRHLYRLPRRCRCKQTATLLTATGRIAAAAE